MPLVHWPECTNNPCTCGQSGDLLFVDAVPVVMCTDCGHLTPTTYAHQVVQLVNGLILWTCDGCWIRYDYPTFMRS